MNSISSSGYSRPSGAIALGVYGSYESADYAGVPKVDQRTKLGATAE